MKVVSSAVASEASQLRRAALDMPARPVRIVHLGLGSFFRAHQAWYTDRAPDAGEWGIAGFTGRRPDLAERLAPQDGLYTLVTRRPDGDSFDVLGSVSSVHAATEHAAWLRLMSSPDVAVVTITVTETGYHRAPDGSLDESDDRVARDLKALRDDAAAPVGTVPGRVLAGLLARAEAQVGPLAVVPCDNLPGNGEALARVVLEMADLVGPGVSSRVRSTATFATTMVDRITPETSAADVDEVSRSTGRADAAPVVTEPFSEWVVCGDFPAGRPRWEEAGVTFTDDVVPLEQRKLWLLNAAHSLIAYGGGLRGHTTVTDAMADPVCSRWVHEWWDEAAPHLSITADQALAYREALLQRWGNSRIRHPLAQVGADGSAKLPVRVLPVLRAERAAGREPAAAARIVGAWVRHLRGEGIPVVDARADELTRAAGGPVRDAVPRVLALLDDDLAADRRVVDLVAEQVDALAAAP